MKLNLNSSSESQRKSDRLAELMAKARASLAEKGLTQIPESKVEITPDIEKAVQSDGDIERQKTEARLDAQRKLTEEFEVAKAKATEEYEARVKAIEDSRPKMEWNLEQSEAIDRGVNGESYNLIGKAGTGKTTCTREIIRAIVASGRIKPLVEGTKYLRVGNPGICVVSFTNRAVKNIARGMSGDMKAHTVTLHKLLEFAPERYTVTDAHGDSKETMRFVPKRNSLNPLPRGLKLLIFEESSMISTELFALLENALPEPIQMIFLGDLQQLPPVYGSAILGFKLLEQKTVELTKIYRQAEGSPIIELAWKIASGQVIGDGNSDAKSREIMEQISKDSGNKIILRPWKKRLDSFDALHIMNRLFAQFVDNKIYDPNEDMIMIPYNKQFGTIEFNLNLAQHLGKQRGAKVHQVIAGFNKFYFAIGDKILVDRQEALIEEIVFNDMYKGVLPMEASVSLNRWGMYEVDGKNHESSQMDLDEVEQFLLMQSATNDDNDAEAKQQGSHVLVCRLLDSDEIVEVRTTGEYSSTVFAYALTVHKCQGSEWRKCFLLLHWTHATLLNRELLYTAVTRAREELYVICEPNTFIKGVKNQRIKGNTIAEKAEFFKGKLEKDM